MTVATLSTTPPRTKNRHATDAAAPRPVTFCTASRRVFAGWTRKPTPAGGLHALKVASVDELRIRRLAAAARVGHLGTVASDGTPHVVPVCFALLGDAVYSAVDHKPKRSSRLRRITNLEATGVACLLVDEYDEDWSKLWWVRIDGSGRVVRDNAEVATALASLAEKYAQYVEQPPQGAVLALDVIRVSGWSATPP
jgi:PPOX class probable F420-dependent enzyme